MHPNLGENPCHRTFGWLPSIVSDLVLPPTLIDPTHPPGRAPQRGTTPNNGKPLGFRCRPHRRSASHHVARENHQGSGSRARAGLARWGHSPGSGKPPQRPLDLKPRPIADDKTVQYDYDIVYVRAPRFVKGNDGKERPAEVWPGTGHPFNLCTATDLMLLHPDGSEEVLVAGGKGAIADPYVSFDAAMGLLHLLPRPQPQRPEQLWRRRHLQGPRQDAQDRPADAAAIHAEHGRGRLVRGLSNPGERQSPPQPARLQHATLPAAGRPGRLRQQPRRLQDAARLDARGAAAVRHGRRRQQRREDRPPERRRRLAPGRAQGRPHHLQLVRIHGHARLRRSIVHLPASGGSGAFIPTAPTGRRSSAPTAIRPRRKPPTISRPSCPTAVSSSAITTSWPGPASAPT